MVLASGPEAQHFVVHQDLLCKHAPFFQLAMAGEWKEAQDGIIPLPDDEPDVVALHIHWLYSSRILCRPVATTGDARIKEMELLVNAFVYGEKIQDGDFKDAVIDAAIKSTLEKDVDGVAWFPGVGTVNNAYDGTPQDSPLRRLVVDFWARRGEKDWNRQGLNTEFLNDLVAELFAYREPLLDLHPSGGKASTCSYHQHGDDSMCYSRRDQM